MSPVHVHFVEEMDFLPLWEYADDADAERYAHRSRRRDTCLCLFRPSAHRNVVDRNGGREHWLELRSDFRVTSETINAANAISFTYDSLPTGAGTMTLSRDSRPVENSTRRSGPVAQLEQRDVHLHSGRRTGDKERCLWDNEPCLR
jgi:hypothetical protein